MDIRNENGVTVSVNIGDVATMRSGNKYIVVELPANPQWPTGVGVGREGNFQDLMLDRIQRTAPATPGSRQLANTINSIGLGSNMPDRVRAMIAAVEEANTTTATPARSAASPTAAGTGNS